MNRSQWEGANTAEYSGTDNNSIDSGHNNGYVLPTNVELFGCRDVPAYAVLHEQRDDDTAPSIVATDL